MCRVTYFQQKTCKHIWATITEPCGPGMGFTTCTTFGDGSLVKDAPKYYRTEMRPCPRCAGRHYDLNSVRMVESVGWGCKWGLGPAREDLGCEIKCHDGCVVL
jgi:hypothetical protein